MLSTTSSSAVKLEFLCDFSSVIAVKSITIAVNPSGMFSMSDIYIAIKLQKQLTRNRFRKLKIAHEFLDWSCMSTSIGRFNFTLAPLIFYKTSIRFLPIALGVWLLSGFIEKWRARKNWVISQMKLRTRFVFMNELYSILIGFFLYVHINAEVENIYLRWNDKESYLI